MKSNAKLLLLMLPPPHMQSHIISTASFQVNLGSPVAPSILNLQSILSEDPHATS